MGARGKIRLIGAVLVVATALTATPVAGAPNPAARERLCSFTDSRIGESSGAAAASFDNRHLWTHNDSGDTARFFLVDTRTCATDATYRLDTPATAVDWEDMARGTTASGAPALFLADIGDNFQFRPLTTVYEVAEPTGSRPAGVSATTEQPVPVLAIHQLRYPGLPVDAETLLFVPQTRQLVVVTKPRTPAPELAYTGASEVYVSAPGLPSTTGVVPMTKVADIDFRALRRTNPTVPESYATSGGDISPDGRHVVVRCYFDLWEWDVPASGDLAAAFATTPRRIIALPTQQGEAVAYTNGSRTLWTTSEGAVTHDPPGAVIDRYRLTRDG